MTQNRTLNRPAGAALAAALLLSTSPLAAQAVDSADPSDTTATSTTTTTTTTTTVEPATDPLAPAASESDTTSVAAKPAATTVAKTQVRPKAAKPRRTTTVAANSAPVAPLPADTAAPVEEAAPLPPVAAIAEPAPTVQPAELSSDDDLLPIAGAAGAGLLALAAAGFALSRRRKARVDEQLPVETEPTFARAAPAPAAPIATAPAPQPALVRPAMVPASAFSWGTTATPAAKKQESMMDAAYRGPTPENPSLSLKKRIKRAAFFEQRERAVKAGAARPVPALAGLPKAVTEQMRATGHRFQAAARSPQLQPA